MISAIPILLSHFAVSPCIHSFLGFVPWNYYLQTDNTCQITGFNVLGANSGILLILLAILDDLFRAAGLLAVVFVIIAGTQFILGQGKPGEMEKARMGILNALVGLGISLVAIAVVSYLGSRLGAGSGTSTGPLGINLSSLPNPAGADSGSLLQTALSIVFGLLGAIAFLVIVIAGFQYVSSQGDPQTTSNAKSTIVYALIGLVIAVLAESIVSFIVHRYP
jgi:cbb3-type cytochrome oxidase subunit 3